MIASETISEQRRLETVTTGLAVLSTLSLGIALFAMVEAGSCDTSRFLATGGGLFYLSILVLSIWKGLVPLVELGILMGFGLHVGLLGSALVDGYLCPLCISVGLCGLYTFVRLKPSPTRAIVGSIPFMMVGAGIYKSGLVG